MPKGSYVKEEGWQSEVMSKQRDVKRKGCQSKAKGCRREGASLSKGLLCVKASLCSSLFA